jgi:hypothetical protein
LHLIFNDFFVSKINHLKTLSGDHSALFLASKHMENILPISVECIIEGEDGAARVSEHRVLGK